MLQLEINNLIEGTGDDMSLASIQKKLGNADGGSRSHAFSSPANDPNNRRTQMRNERLQELHGIYSDYRVDG